PAPRQAPAGHGHCGGLGGAALLRLSGGAAAAAGGDLAAAAARPAVRGFAGAGGHRAPQAICRASASGVGPGVARRAGAARSLGFCRRRAAGDELAECGGGVRWLGMAAPGAGGRAGGVAVHRLLAGQPGGPPAGPWATDNALRPSASDGVAPDVRQLEVLLAGEPRALAGGAVVSVVKRNCYALP
ncbi:unnamed protein product, partial [Effrenium voratum]